jgi:hypothetical protein
MYKEHMLRWAPALLEKIGLASKKLPRKNTLAYLAYSDAASVSKKKV